VTISSTTPDEWSLDVPLTGTGGTPKVAVLSPDGGEVIASGSTHVLNWWAPSEAVTFKLQYSTNNGATWKTIAADLSGMTHDWTVPVLRSNKKACLLKVTGYDISGSKVGANRSDAPFTIEVASITAPIKDEIVPGSTTAYPVTWITNGISEDVSSAQVFYTSGNAGTWKKALGTVTNPRTSFDWDVPSPTKPIKAKLKVVFKDASGKKLATAISSVFRIE